MYRRNSEVFNKASSLSPKQNPLCFHSVQMAHALALEKHLMQVPQK